MTISAERTAMEKSSGATPPAGLKVAWTNRPGWLSQHLGTAVVGAVLGYVLGHWLGNYITGNYPYIANSGQNA